VLSILCFICLRPVSCAQYCLFLCVVHSLFYLSSSSVLCLILPEETTQRHRQY
jgi:hypothetical protein